MENLKQSFILFNDIIDSTDELSDEEAGKIFKMILAKVNGKSIESDSKLLRLVFKPIEKSLERNLQKYENKINEKSNAGIIGNLKRWHPNVYKDFDQGNISLEEAQKLAKTRKTSQSDKSIAKVAVSVPVPEIDIEHKKTDVFEDYKNQLKTEGVTEWVEAMYIQFKFKPKNLGFVMEDFIAHVKCSPNPPPPNLKEFKNHFYNWCNRVTPEGKLNKYLKNPPKQAGAL